MIKLKYNNKLKLIKNNKKINGKKFIHLIICNTNQQLNLIN